MAGSSVSAATVLTTYATLLTVALAMIAARYHLRFRNHRTRRLLMSDLLMGGAWCAALTTASFDVVLHRKGALDPKINYTLINFEAPVEDLEYVAKMVWASVIPFYATLYLCKLSIVTVYLQLFPVFMVKLRIALWTVLGFCISSFLVIISLQLFMCWPIQGNWQISKPEIMCDNEIPQLVFHVGWALHFTGNVAIFILPFFLIHKLQMRLPVKIGVYGVLLLGAIDIAFSLTRFLVVQLPDATDFRSITGIELWSALDMMVGLIVTCLPSLRPYLRRDPKASSSNDTPGLRKNAFGASQSITVNRKTTVTNTTSRWREHGQFEELDSNEDGRSDITKESYHSHTTIIGNSVHVNGGRRERVPDEETGSWQDERRCHKNNIKLKPLKNIS